MTALELLRINLHVAHDGFVRTTADVTQEMLDWVPPGMALPISERWAHAVAAEDWLVQEIAQGGKPWLATTWTDKVGFNAADMNFTASNEQRRAFRVNDIAQLREFETAVFAASEEYLNALDEAAMDRMIDMSFIGIPQVPAPAWWSAFVIGHLHDLMGEISILKGCLGYKGYPF